jgi:hypothetical protein
MEKKKECIDGGEKMVKYRNRNLFPSITCIEGSALLTSQTEQKKQFDMMSCT